MGMAGRPSTYTEEMGRRICDAIASSKGGLRKTLASDPELPELHTVQSWLANIAQFSSDYALAKRTQIETMAEDIIDISNDDSLEPNDKRIRVDTLKWLLSKLIPKTYGDKLDLTSDGQALAPASHLIDARVQSILMQVSERRKAMTTGLDAKALSLLD